MMLEALACTTQSRMHESADHKQLSEAYIKFAVVAEQKRPHGGW